MTWRDEKSQQVWLWIGLVFLVFYTAEAGLFWGPEPRVIVPPFVYLLYWGTFGAILIVLIARSAGKADPKKWLNMIRSTILGVGITSAVVGIPFLIIARTHDITLGHAVMLFTIALAAVVIGAWSFNAGWLLAGCLWVSGGCMILALPRIQDYMLGAVLAIGFMVVGVLRRSPVTVCGSIEKK
ncbi:MAG: hypothetical protein ABSG86_21195 [Thermoguttaceae bacterium]|jgi:hypothetical protein